MVNLLEAYQVVNAAIEPMPTTTLSIEEAVHRVTGEPVRSPSDHPRFNQSAMDGYVLNAEDRETLAPLFVDDVVVAAGDWPEIKSTPGTAIRIFTGGKVPNGGESVRIQEMVRSLDDGRIILDGKTATGRNIRYRGEDIAAGDQILPVGHQITPADLMALANLHIKTICVPRPPKVAFTTSGNELIEFDGPAPTKSQVVDGNRIFLNDALSAHHCYVTALPRLGDNRVEIERTVEAFSEFDLVVTSGGMSAGDFDLLGRVVRERGDVLVYKIAVKPGKPVLLAKLGKTIFVGLPGNPVSTFVSFQLLVVPILRRLMGYITLFPKFSGVSLANDVDSGGGRLEFKRALIEDVGGTSHVRLMPNQGSAALSGLLGCDALVARPAHAPRLSLGELVGVFDLKAGVEYVDFTRFEQSIWPRWLL